jgi:hypothetical protein
MFNRPSSCIGLVWAAVGLGLPALAQEAPEKYLELLRSDLRTEKVEIVTEALQLSEADAAAFWPIYRQYETELSALGDRRIALIKQFADAWGAVTDEAASGFADDWFAIQKDRLKLREKYFGRIEKATSSKIAARFTQVENTLGMLLDLQIAAELPLLE